jgi:hypothetical protein
MGRFAPALYGSVEDAATARGPYERRPERRYYFVDAEARSSEDSRDEAKARAVFDETNALLARAA